jgi:uncharacterized protein YifN (PemK superfamily)
MPIQHHPKQACLVTVNFDGGFRPPEMVKTRLAVILSKLVGRRVGLCTVIPLSTLPPDHIMPYHEEIDIGFDLPRPWLRRCWVKGDMVTSVGYHRVELLRWGRRRTGRREYLTTPLDEATFRAVQRCALHGLGLSVLTKNLTASI